MADPLKQMCDELGVCTEEALFYLEGFRWDLSAATEACRSKTLPYLTADQPPSSENERVAAEEQRGDEKESSMKPKKPVVPVSGNEGSGLVQEEEVLSQVPHESHRIESPLWHRTAPFRLVQRSMNLFQDVISTATVQDITDCLNHCKGDVDAAIIYYSKKEDLMDSFCSRTEETRQVAKFYMEQYNWDLALAVDSFFKHIDSEERQTSALNNTDLETQTSLEEAGEGDDTVADETEAVPDPTFANRDRTTTVETQAAPSTIVMTINLAHIPGTSLELPFRSDQTLRDIHNAIDQRYPDRDRGYVLQSMDGVDYIDWDITVDRVSAGDSTFLLQVYP